MNKIYSRLWPYIKRYLSYTIIAVVSTLIVSATSALIAWMVKPLMDHIFVNKDSDLLLVISFSVTSVFAVKAFFTYLQSYMLQYASYRIINDLRDDLFDHLIYLPLSEYHKTDTGNLMSRMINDVGSFSRLGATAIKDMLQQTFTIIGLLVVVYMRDWKLAIIATLVFPFAGLFVNKYGKRMRRVSRKAQESIADILSALQESFTGIRIIKAFTMEEREKERFGRENEIYTGLVIKTSRISSTVSPTMEVFAGVGIGLTLFYGGSNVIGGTMTPGDFFSFTAALAMLYPPVKSLSGLHNSMQQAIAAAERVVEMFDMPTEKDVIDAGKDLPVNITDGIEFRSVSFRYAGKEEDVLNGVDLTIKKGEVVALVGSSGGGKTTLVNMIPRFHDVVGGSITIDGTDIREFKLRSLRERISIVTQDTILFNDTVAVNIAYGSDKYSPEQIADAAKAAHADGFIARMPSGYDTFVGEKGVLLSGGEKQRVSIARALLKDSPILILDEATSSLDTESERIVQKALENLMKGRTTLVIAHRLSTIINADKIVVIDKGTVAAEGRHQELLGKSPIYKRLYEMQFGRMEGDKVEAV
ncbi:MAG: ATP-binding cassette domain-containing protein [Nitrospirae bacterium]|nr:ATP-binding cassette domain-containing protein [Nitrospirota bacterium]MBI5694807.1 ATP-binding cassette domain-containing protein [Nitrospirota bacterium]